MKDVPTISIDLDKNCTRCEEKGATPSGLCLKCIGASINDAARNLRKEKKVGTEYVNAPAVRIVGRQLIDRHHPHLRGVRVEFVFVEKRDKDGMPQPWEVNGKEKFGDTKKVSGLNAFLAMDEGASDPEDFFVILVSSYFWSYLTEEQRAAYLDHYITRCALHEEKGTPVLRDPEVVEFGEVLKRHGLYHAELKGFVEIGAKQLQLPLEAKEDGKGKKAAKGAAKAKQAGAPARP